jgi:hypothetical protein
MSFLRAWLKKKAEIFIAFCFLQLFLMLVSLLILAPWGLSLPLMSIVGNLIFIPFIGLYLLFSLLIFTMHLFCGFSPSFLLFLLELLTSCWIWVLSLPTVSVNFILPTPAFFISCLTIVLASSVLTAPGKRIHKIGLLLIVALFFYRGTLFLCKPPTEIGSKKIGKKQVVVLSRKRLVVAVSNHEMLEKNSSFSAWLVKTYGKKELDALFSQRDLLAKAPLRKVKSIFSCAASEVPFYCFPSLHSRQEGY